MKKILFFALLAIVAAGCTKESYEQLEPVVPEPEGSKQEQFIPSYEQDSLALVAFYNATGGEQWPSYICNWKTAPLHKWLGVKVQKVDGERRVVSLSLLNMNLTGSLPSEIGHLTALRALDLNENDKLGGQIPEELYSLTSLEVLRLRFTGITGGLSESVSKLQKLDTLDLSKPYYNHDQQLTGELPKSLGKLTTMRYLDLDNNAFTGEIPAEIGDMSNLTELQLWYNQLSGTIPASLSKLTDLRILSIGNNALTGSIPAELGQLKNLEELYLDENKLTGSIPATMGDLEAIRDLVFAGNQLTGQIPSTLTKLKRLGILRLENNQLSGEIPVGLCNENPMLVAAWLHNNNLTGAVPVLTGFHIGTVKDKWYCWLQLHGNRLTGDIPAWILQFPNDCRKNLIPQQQGYGFANESAIKQ